MYYFILFKVQFIQSSNKQQKDRIDQLTILHKKVRANPIPQQIVFCGLANYINYNLVWQMEVQYGFLSYQRLIRYLVFSQNVFTITTFLNFINPQQVQAMAQLALDSKRTQKFYKIAVAKLFTNSYFNRVDRGIFFLFYDEPQFQSIQKNTINALAYRNYQFLEKAYHSFQSILAQLSTRTSYLQSNEQLKQTLQNIFFQPDMPMPKMKRQTIGMYCQTAFQQFLSLKRFQEQDLIGDEWLQKPLQQLKQQLQKEVSAGIASNQPIIEQLMETVRYRGWMVNCQTWRQYLINQFHTHNLLVILLAMSSQLIQTVNVLLQTIEDPLMRFVQFNLRSAIFRNIVLTIQERLSFAISAYDKIYQNKIHPPQQRPPFCFWRAALSMWEQRMWRYHGDNKKVYEYITVKLRENSLMEYLAPKTELLPSVYSELRGKVELNDFSEVLKNQAYVENGGGRELESFFQTNLQLYEVLVKDYLQYSVDLSINQINVHWCGHSQHAISRAPIYRQIMNGFLQNSHRYYQHLKSLIQDSIPGDLRILTFREMVKEDLQFVGLKLAKPYTVRQLLQVANKMIRDMVENMGQFAVFGEEVMAKYRIFIDFQEKDNLLAYFGAKADIKMDCPNPLRYFYDLQLDPQTEIPKSDMVEIDAQSCGEDHQIYDSGNEEDENGKEKEI